jgi:hypothetical protein
MDAEVGRAAFRLGMLIFLPSLVLLLFVPRGTAEFVITVVTLGLSGLYLAAVVLAVRLMRR